MSEYGKRTLPQVLDNHASVTPKRLYASISRNKDISHGFQDITCDDMARCVNFVAHWIVARFNQSSHFGTIAYIGIPDLRSATIFLGSVKAGYKVLLPSPRNPPATNLSLMKQTSCTRVLYAIEVAPVIEELKSRNGRLITEVIPSFHDMLKARPTYFPFNSQYEYIKDDPILILHSSGSTGPPKPITMTHATFAVLDNERKLPKVPGRRNRDYSIWDFKDGGRFYTVFPYFHLAGFLSLLVNPIFTESSSPILGPPLMPPNAELLKAVMEYQSLRALYLPPSIAEQLVHEPNGLDLFKGLDFICYTGGPFSPEVGIQLSTITELCPLYGSTEAFQVPQLAPSQEDWAWMEWNPHFKLDMQPYPDEEGAFELVLFADKSTEHMSALNHNLPEISEYRSKDLFKQHPYKTKLWQYYGRRDDIIVLSSGGKFNPVPFELKLQSHPIVMGALVVGIGRVQPALIIEVTPEAKGEAPKSIIERILSTVEKANHLVPGQGRILRNRILISRPDKAFVRAGKGTVVRKLTEKLYQSEIDELYATIDDNLDNDLPTLKPTQNLVYEIATIKDFIRDILSAVSQEMRGIEEDQNLFSHGLDSIKTGQFVGDLRVALQQSHPMVEVSWITPRLVYQNPSIGELATLVHEFLQSGKHRASVTEISRVVTMQKLVEHYSADLKEPQTKTRPPSNQKTVAIIGSTGYLGPYILASLLQDSSVTKIFCLNRDEDADKRTFSALQHIYGLASIPAEKLSFMTVQLGSPSFSLNEVAYSVLTSTVHDIIFNSWNPNFSLPLSAFEQPFLQGLHNVINWSLSSTKRPRIIFVSSIAAVGNWSRLHQGQYLIPEVPAQDSRAAMDMGYGESKCVAEQILTRVHKAFGVSIAIIRAGQIGGPSDSLRGSWPRQGWLSSLIKVSKQIEAFPARVSPLDWIPVDTFASAIANILKSEFGNTLQAFNMVHPEPKPWSLFVGVLQRHFGMEYVEMSLPGWIRNLDKTLQSTPKDSRSIQKPKIYDFLVSLGEGREGDMGCKTDNAEALVASVHPLSEELLLSWLKSWNLGLNKDKYVGLS